MQSRPFEMLRRAMVVEGIPAAYASRFAGEIEDHFVDVVCELKEAGMTGAEAVQVAQGRVGEVGLLTQAAVKKYREGTMMGRHACLFFAILPLVLVPVMIMLPVVIGAQALDASRLMNEGLAPDCRWMVRAMIVVLAYFYPVLIGIGYYRAARRRALPWRWRIGACAAAVAWGAWLHYGLWFKGAADRHGMFSIALQPMPSVIQGVLIAAAICAYVGFVERRGRLGPLLSA